MKHPVSRSQRGITKFAPADACRAGMIELALLAAVGAVFTLPARADDGQRGASTLVAAVGSDSGTPLSRLGMPARPAALDADLRVLLADKGPPAHLDVTPADDTILVALAIDVPQSVDDDIAKQYNLELLERTELADLGLRIVQYRTSGNQTTSAVLSALRHDQRIRKAQRNVQHTLPGSNPPAAVSSNDTKDKPVSQPTARHYTKPDSKRLRTARTPTPQPITAKPATAQKPVVAARADPTPRVGGIGDVLSGGL